MYVLSEVQVDPYLHKERRTSPDFDVMCLFIIFVLLDKVSERFFSSWDSNRKVNRIDMDEDGITHAAIR